VLPHLGYGRLVGGIDQLGRGLEERTTAGSGRGVPPYEPVDDGQRPVPWRKIEPGKVALEVAAAPVRAVTALQPTVL
jgi:hypothetical protein